MRDRAQTGATEEMLVCHKASLGYFCYVRLSISGIILNTTGELNAGFFLVFF